MPTAPHWGIPGRGYTQLSLALELTPEELGDHWAFDILVYLLIMSHHGMIQGSPKAINLSGSWTEAFGKSQLSLRFGGCGCMYHCCPGEREVPTYSLRPWEVPLKNFPRYLILETQGWGWNSGFAAFLSVT